MDLAKGDHPVVAVSWNDAKAFCAWASRKTGQRVALPTEA
jgi:formylglycine-generating enzyme required for sulfatase activity